jgi:glycosyltransferase involved in cell wall biosynthesis
MKYPKISIITPSFNLADYLEQTIQSVVKQSYPNLEYIIIDGGSTDLSVDIIKRYQKHLTYWVSEPDQGLYHALQKGFDQTTGNIMGWLNADDMLHPNALFTIARAFQDLPEIDWLQGYPTVFNKTGSVVYHRPPRVFKYDFYLKKYHDGQFVQQESTYWRRGLWEKAGGYISQQYRLAGDFELWMRFFNHAPLYPTLSLIGGFRARGGQQLSYQHREQYMREADTIIDAYHLAASEKDKEITRKLAFWKKIAQFIPKGEAILRYSSFYQRQVHQPPWVSYNLESDKFQLD